MQSHPRAEICKENIKVYQDEVIFSNFNCGEDDQEDENTGGGSGGGGSDGSGNKTDTIGIDENMLDNACMYNTLNNVLANKSKIVDLVQDVFGTSNIVNLTFKEVSTLIGNSGVQVPGQTNFEFQGDYKSVVISLNSSMLNGTAQEYMASVIIHEMVHAYLDGHEYLYFNGQENQHNEIAMNYVDKISSALMSIFSNLALREAQALSIGGLSDISTPYNYQQLKLHYGFNEDPSSVDSYGYFYLPFSQKGGYRGSRCTN